MTPTRWLQVTTLAAAIYATAGIIDAISPSFNMSRQLSGAIQASLGVGFILSGGAYILDRYSSRIAAEVQTNRDFLLAKLAEAHDEREEFRRRFDALTADLAEHEQHRVEAEVADAARRVNGRLSIVEKL